MRKNNKALAAIGTPLLALLLMIAAALPAAAQQLPNPGDRKSTRLNSSHRT